MGYMHIDNLYKPEAQDILQFKQCYALEKVHGTSAHVAWTGTGCTFFSGGVPYTSFVALFDVPALEAKFKERFGEIPVVVYGEAYGGSCQAMSATYGKNLKFVAFDVCVDRVWLAVPKADAVAQALGLEFVHYELVDTSLAVLDMARDKPSVQAKRNGILEDRPAEGVVLRPPFEVTKNNGARVMAKHKRADFEERRTPPPVDAAKLKVLEEAEAIATEWVTDMRLTHVLDKLGNPTSLSDIPKVTAAMVEDVLREAAGEIVDSKEARRAISTHTVKLYKLRVQAVSAGANSSPVVAAPVAVPATPEACAAAVGG